MTKTLCDGSHTTVDRSTCDASLITWRYFGICNTCGHKVEVNRRTLISHKHYIRSNRGRI